ncbi:MAG: ThuA domain-containing protein [Clostridia bacterium]|nr:ThuA domain-containing protein [Clostridia bacterium]
MKKALIFQGGWEGHEPKLVSRRFAGLLERNGYEVKITDTLDTLLNRDYLMSLDLIVPCWTMGEIPQKCRENICAAVANGTGLAGCHGGMCDSFRQDTEWQFMTGGQWVSHPGGDGTNYTVNVRSGSSPIVEGIEDFEVCSEQYYLHIDPAVEVLATTRFPVANYYHASNKKVDMPVVWTKYWGCGRVFYNSLGHHDDVFDNSPAAEIIMERGMLWAGEGKEYAVKNGLSVKKYEE